MSVVRLSNDDRCAVDLILERSQTGPEGITTCYTAAPSDEMQQRLTRVEKILHLLDAHTPIEPTADLVTRTLARCDQQAQVAGTAPVQPISASDATLR
jgi:hypothetical protein